MKTILALAVLSQLVLVQPAPPIHDGIRPIEIVEFEPVKPLEPLTVDFKPIPVYPTVSGDWVAQCHAWASQAGITLPPAAIKLIERESKCSPTSRNPTSSAGGIPQALPWTKMGCSLSTDGAPCQLEWMYNYVSQRYGGWEQALDHSYSHNWY